MSGINKTKLLTKNNVFALLFALLVMLIFFLGVKNISDHSQTEDINLVYPLPEITSDVTYQQTICPERDDLSSISLKIATFGRYNTCKLNVLLEDEQGNKVHEWSIPCETLSDNIVITLDLSKPLEDCKGKIYYLSFTTDAQEGNGVTVYCNNAPGRTGLAINGELQDLTLCHQITYKYSWLEGIREIYSQIPMLVILLALVFISIPVLSFFLTNRYSMKASTFLLLPLIIYALSIHRIYDYSDFTLIPIKPSPYTFITILLVFTILCIIASIVIFELIFKRDCPLERIAIIAVSLFSLVSLVFFTPGTTPDETAHYLTSYNYSNTLVALPMRIDDYEEPDWSHIYMRDCDMEFIKKCSQAKLSVNSYVDVSDEFELVTTNGTESLYSTKTMSMGKIDRYPPAPMGYMASALGISLGRILHLGAAPTYYLGRIFNIIAFIIMVYFAIKIIPIGKEVLLIISLFPIVQQETASYSYDSFILGIAFLFTALLIAVIYNDNKASLSQLIGLAVLCFILAPSKLVYFPLVGAILLIQNSKISFKKPLLIKFALIAAGIIGLVVFQAHNLKIYVSLRTVMADSINNNIIPTFLNYDSLDIHYTFSDFVSNPLGFIELLLMSLYHNAIWYLSTMIGGSLGWFQISTPLSIYGIYLIFLLISLIRSDDEKIFFSNGARIWIRLLSLASFLLVFISMAVTYLHPTSIVIDGVQGRYFLPFIPLLVFSMRTKGIKLNSNINKKISWGVCYMGFIFWTHCFLYLLGAIGSLN